MNRRLFWKLCLIYATGVVAMFYLIDYATLKAEQSMSMLAQSDRDQLRSWGAEAEAVYLAADPEKLKKWLRDFQEEQKIIAAIVRFQAEDVAGDLMDKNAYIGFNLGRNVDWPVHLYFQHTPVMEIPFRDGSASFLVLLPDDMRPGSHWRSTRLVLQVILPMLLLAALSWLVYRHIMRPLGQLQRATMAFSLGDYSVRVCGLLGNRNDELSHLSKTFDQMAERIGEQIVNQRHLIADLSHELRTPLARLDIAVESAQSRNADDDDLMRASRESRQIRRLVEDALTLAWLANEQPSSAEETLDLVDLIDVIVEDASFEFPDRTIEVQLPTSAKVENSNHRAVGQALENIIRNALRFTPAGKSINVGLLRGNESFQIDVMDQGPGVPEDLLETIFQPFFRVDKSRSVSCDSFGLGLALARRQLRSVGGKVFAANRQQGGLCMTIVLPCCHQTA